MALSPAKKSANVTSPTVENGDVVVDKDGDFLKPVVVIKSNKIKGLDPSVFSQLSSGNSTVGVLNANPENVAVLPLNGSPRESSGNSSSKAFSQTPFPVIQFKLHRHHDHREIL